MKPRDICKECGGWCCVKTLKMVTPTERKFFEYCGQKVRILKDGRYVMEVGAPCKFYKDGECSIYGTGKRPDTCRNYPKSYHEIFAPHCKLMRELYSRGD
jgi:Fe-S-cluster containining protein